LLDDVIGWLRCPACGAALARAVGTLRCRNGHAFDIARQGYVSLLASGLTPVGDTAAMVQARIDFLAAGHYGPLADAVAAAACGAAGGAAAGGAAAGGAAWAAQDPPGCVADVGAGTGYYLAAVLDRAPGRAGLALDASKFAARRAARAHDRIGAIVADVRGRLPVADRAAALALSVFAPRPPAELRRVLHPAGRLLVITPDSDHLGELAGPLGLLAVDPRKDERLTARLRPYFDLAGQSQHRFRLALGHRDVAAAVAMGPSAWHADPAELTERIAALPSPMPVTVSVTMWTFRPADQRDTRGLR
jgi:23S rRNA (guanine745-N1)-methyltransferase